MCKDDHLVRLICALPCFLQLGQLVFPQLFIAQKFKQINNQRHQQTPFLDPVLQANASNNSSVTWLDEIACSWVSCV